MSAAQQAAMAEAIRITQCIRTSCLRLWMDGRGRGITANDLQTACSCLAHAVANARFARSFRTILRQAAVPLQSVLADA